ncbi:SAM-dependent DNA methyltransferase [Clavibacter phaseoli]|nr:SAM-dependent DNA methyltransferase [Clavibacter phaseoli]
MQQALSGFLTIAPLGLIQGQVAKVEVPTGDGTRRRIDVEFGKLIVEVKKDLAVALAISRAEPQLNGYLKTKRDETGDEYAGIVTDGVIWILYTLAGDELREVQRWELRKVDSDAVDRLVAWLDSILLTGPKLKPTPARIEERLGASSPRFKLDRARLQALYDAHGASPEIALKRDLWARLLRTALGTNFEDDSALFLDHTLLVIEAEIIAHLAVGLDPSDLRAGALLAGDTFKQSGIHGVVEADFFDWPAYVPGGAAVVTDLVRELVQFDWAAVEHDILKHLYEAIISTETRKGLGEYYTADWLAEMIVQERVTDPLNQKVMDPACGSGTFVFHAVRRFLEAADAAAIPNAEALDLLQDSVFGMDIHPVSVVLARVTYLLAIGQERLSDRNVLSIPVFLGDSIQWGRGTAALNSDVFTIEVDGEDLAASESEEGTLGGFAESLTFPLGDNPGELDLLISDITDLASEYHDDSQPIASISHILDARGVTCRDHRQTLTKTFGTLCGLNARGRDHIWGYFVRNQLRPLWLARHPVDVLIGNPPWVAYRYMTRLMQVEFKRMLETRQLWAGGSVATNQDLAALFIARSVEVFLKPGGAFAYVTPYAVLSRLQYERFRTGRWLQTQAVSVNAAFTSAWDLADVRPDLFPVPSAVVFGVRATAPEPLPEEVTAFRGRASALEKHNDTVIQLSAEDGYASPYATRVIQGATIVPRVLTFVDELPQTPLGRPTGTTAVTSARSSQEKVPWKNLQSVEGPIEKEFLREVLLGSSVVPYRVVWPHCAVLPVGETGVLTLSQMVSKPLLKARWESISALWDLKKTPSTKLSLLERLDFRNGLTRQLPTAPHRVLYTASGNRIAALYTNDTSYLVEHKLYWLSVESSDEGHYLAAILNSDAVAEAVEKRQSRGLFGTRDIDLLPWRLAIPAFDPSNELHARISGFGFEAETKVAELEVLLGEGFQSMRGRIRKLLAEDGVWGDINTAVEEVLETAEPVHIAEGDIDEALTD